MIWLFMQIVSKTGFDISNVKSCFLGKNVKNISKCRLLKKNTKSATRQSFNFFYL